MDPLYHSIRHDAGRCVTFPRLGKVARATRGLQRELHRGGLGVAGRVHLTPSQRFQRLAEETNVQVEGRKHTRLDFGFGLVELRGATATAHLKVEVRLWAEPDVA
jgi:hypothetical protein